jgi:hypothetical protein
MIRVTHYCVCMVTGLIFPYASTLFQEPDNTCSISDFSSMYRQGLVKQQAAPSLRNSAPRSYNFEVVSIITGTCCNRVICFNSCRHCFPSMRGMFWSMIMKSGISEWSREINSSASCPLAAIIICTLASVSTSASPIKDRSSASSSIRRTSLLIRSENKVIRYDCRMVIGNMQSYWKKHVAGYMVSNIIFRNLIPLCLSFVRQPFLSPA